MENIIRQTTELALYIVRSYVKAGSVVVDATCGNGKDTLALASMNPAKLYAFDVQETAVRETVRLLEENGYADRLTDGRIIVKQQAHENMREFLDGKEDTLNAAVFNLGYLPGGSKAVTTKAETTLAAVRGAMDLLTADGLVCITMYSGHPKGKEEKTTLLEFAEGLDAVKWHCAYISMPNQKNDPPEILLITRKK